MLWSNGGVGEDITFEQELIRRFGVKIYIFDPAPVAARTVALAKSDRLLFRPRRLAASTVRTLLDRRRNGFEHMAQGRWDPNPPLYQSRA